MLFSRHVNHFMAVAEAKTLKEAAEQVALTPSALSRSIGELESRLGEPLLRRTRTGVVLTPKGKYLWKSLSPYFQGVSHIIDHLTNGSQNDTHITIGLDNMFYPALKDKLARLIDRFPDKKFSLIPHQDMSVETALGTNGNDFLLTVLEPHTIAKNADVCQIAMNPEPVGLMVSDILYQQYPDVRTLLSKVGLIQRQSTLTHPLFQILDAFLQQERYEYHSMGVPDLTEVCHLVAEGHGVSLMSQELQQHLLFQYTSIRWIKNPLSFPLHLQRYLYFRRSRFETLSDIATCLHDV